MSSIESIRQLKLPQEVESRLRELIRLSGEGSLNAREKNELNLLIETRESLSLLRRKAEKLAETLTPASAELAINIRNGLPVVIVPTATPAIDPVVVRRTLQEQGF